MPNYTTPGVYINESRLNSRSNNVPSGPTAFFAGRAGRGPTDATYVANWGEYRRLYGNLTDAYDLGYAVYHFFANGGRGCWVARVVGPTNPAAADVSAINNFSGNGVPFYPYGQNSSEYTLATYAITSQVATITTTASHNLIVGDVVTIASSGTVTAIDGAQTVVEVVDDTTFTFAAAGATDVVETGDAGTLEVSNTSAARWKSLFDAEAISAGAWGNGLTLQIEAGTVPSSSERFGSFNLVVRLDGVEVERWNEVAVESTDNRYVATIVNTYSDYIKVDSVNPDAVAASASSTYYTSSVPFDGGDDGGEPTSTEYTNALNTIDGVEGVVVMNAVPYVNANGDSVGNDTNTTTAFLNKAQERGTAFVIVDPDKGVAAVSGLETVANRATVASNGNYGAHYTPSLLMVDPAKSGPGAIRDTYPGGAVAGLYVRTDVEQNVAKAPAGYAADIRGALGLSVNLTDANIGDFYSGARTPQTNCFKAVPGGGIVVYGARTLTKVGADRYIPIRRTLNYLRYTLDNLTKFAVFEPNDQRLWARIRGAVSSNLSSFYNEGGLKGANAAQSFYVVCDETNNTPISIDQGIVNVEVGVALQYPAEFIVINLSQWSGGSNAVESL